MGSPNDFVDRIVQQGAEQSTENIGKSVLHGAAGVAGNVGANALLGVIENQMYKKNQRDNFRYSQQAQQNAALNNVIGLKKAGLSPALATGAGAFTPAPMASAPQQSKTMPGVDFSDIALKFAEIGNLGAGAGKSVQETNNLETQNALAERALQMQKDIDGTALLRWREKNEDAWNKFVNEFYKGDEDLAKEQATIGLIYGQNEYKKSIVEAMRYANEEMVEKFIFDDPTIAKAIAHVPDYAQRKIKAEIAYIGSQDKQLQELTAQLKDVDKRKKEADLRHVEQEIKSLQQSIKESAQKINTLKSQSFKNYTSGSKDIVDSLNGAIDAVLNMVTGGKYKGLKQVLHEHQHGDTIVNNPKTINNNAPHK